jgi:hypothetical protein
MKYSKNTKNNSKNTYLGKLRQILNFHFSFHFIDVGNGKIKLSLCLIN